MRALSICMGLLLSMGLLVGKSNANITFSQTNDTAATVSSGGTGGFAANAVRSVSFTSANFGNHPTAEIVSIDVAVTFRKLRGPNPITDLNPFYNEISMVFGKTEVGNTTLIGNGPIGGDADSFSLGVGAGFNGTVTFSSTAAATAPVNRSPNQDNIPNTPGTVYRPANTVALSTPWSAFVGQSAIGTFNLNLADIDDAGDTSVDPLEFVSMTVTITAVPEPSSFGLCGLLTLGGAFIRRRVRA